MASRDYKYSNTVQHIPCSSTLNNRGPFSPTAPVIPAYGQLNHFPLDPQFQMHRMSEDMNDMYRQMQQQVSQNVGGDTWLNEDMRMDNPVETDPEGKRKFKLHFDLHQFKPEEISITTKDRNLTVSAKHVDTKEGRSVNREYNRSYALPDEVDTERLTSKLSAEGILNVEAPLQALEYKKEHVIPIQHHT